METKVTAIIQARMNSTRLPGKVLMEIMGRPLLSYMLEALQTCKTLRGVIVATTTNRENDLIASFCGRTGLKIYRGSEENVLDRYYQSARENGCMHVMRLTADCPLIQPHICDLVAESYFRTGCDYIRTGESFAEGVDCEIFSMEALEKAWKEAELNSEKEHVTLFFRNRPEIFRTEIVENNVDDSRYRITVDEPADFMVVKEVIENLYDAARPYIEIGKIKQFLDSRPELFALNAKILRNEGLLKSLKEESGEDPKKWSRR